MAFAVISFENKRSNQLKLAPVGYSWTNLIFGFFVPLFRGDWKWAIIFLIVGIVTWGFGSIVTSFFYNKLHASDLMKDGFKIKSLNGADKDLVKAKLGIAKL